MDGIDTPSHVPTTHSRILTETEFDTILKGLSSHIDHQDQLNACNTILTNPHSRTATLHVASNLQITKNRIIQILTVFRISVHHNVMESMIILLAACVRSGNNTRSETETARISSIISLGAIEKCIEIAYQVFDSYVASLVKHAQSGSVPPPSLLQSCLVFLADIVRCGGDAAVTRICNPSLEAMPFMIRILDGFPTVTGPPECVPILSCLHDIGGHVTVRRYVHTVQCVDRVVRCLVKVCTDTPIHVYGDTGQSVSAIKDRSMIDMIDGLVWCMATVIRYAPDRIRDVYGAGVIECVGWLLSRRVRSKETMSTLVLLANATCVNRYTLSDKQDPIHDEEYSDNELDQPQSEDRIHRKMASIVALVPAIAQIVFGSKRGLFIGRPELTDECADGSTHYSGCVAIGRKVREGLRLFVRDAKIICTSSMKQGHASQSPQAVANIPADPVIKFSALVCLKNMTLGFGDPVRVKTATYIRDLLELVDTQGWDRLDLVEEALDVLRNLAMVETPARVRDEIASGVDVFVRLLTESSMSDDSRNNDKASTSMKSPNLAFNTGFRLPKKSDPVDNQEPEHDTPWTSIHTKTLCILINVSVSDHASQTLAVEGGQPLFSALFTIMFSPNTYLQRLSLSAIRNLCIDETACKTIMNMGTHTIISLLHHATCPVQLECLQILRNLITQYKESFTIIYDHEGFLEEIVSALCSTNRSTQKCAVDIIQACLDYGESDPRILHDLVDTGCLQALLVPMNEFCDSRVMAAKCFERLKMFDRCVNGSGDPWTRIWQEWQDGGREQAHRLLKGMKKSKINGVGNGKLSRVSPGAGEKTNVSSGGKVGLMPRSSTKNATSMAKKSKKV